MWRHMWRNLLRNGIVQTYRYWFDVTDNTCAQIRWEWRTSKLSTAFIDGNILSTFYSSSNWLQQSKQKSAFYPNLLATRFIFNPSFWSWHKLYKQSHKLTALEKKNWIIEMICKLNFLEWRLVDHSGLHLDGISPDNAGLLNIRIVGMVSFWFFRYYSSEVNKHQLQYGQL